MYTEIKYNNKQVGFVKNGVFYTTRYSIFKLSNSINVSQGVVSILKNMNIRIIEFRLILNGKTEVFRRNIKQIEEYKLYTQTSDHQWMLPLDDLRKNPKAGAMQTDIFWNNDKSEEVV